MKEQMEHKAKVYVVEDRAITRETIVMSLTTLGFEVVGQNDEAEPALEEMRNLEVDIAILDIDLKGEKSGVWLAHQINAEIEIPFIYLTAFGDARTLTEVMETRPHGFLMKPYNEPNIYTAILIALDNFSKQESAADKTVTEPSDSENFRVKDSLFIKDRNLLVRCKIDEICYIKSDGKYLDIYLKQKQHLVRSKMTDFMDYLPQEVFIQVHRRYVINIGHATAVGAGFVQVMGEDIPVSKNFKDALNDKLIMP